MVDGLLAVARAENVVAEPVSIPVDEVIRDRVAAWRPVAEERGVDLRQSSPGPVCAWPARGTWSRCWTTCWPTPSTRCRLAATS